LKCKDDTYDANASSLVNAPFVLVDARAPPVAADVIKEL